MHPSQYRPTPVSTTPSRRLNTLAALAECHGLGFDLQQTIDGSNKYTEQYQVTVRAAYPSGAFLQVLASRSKTRNPLRPWHFYLTYTSPAKNPATAYMKRWDTRLVKHFYYRVVESNFLSKMTSLSARMAQLDRT